MSAVPGPSLARRLAAGAALALAVVAAVIPGRAARAADWAVIVMGLSYSHTHSAPATFGGWLTEGMDLVDQWLLDLPGAAADAVAQAIDAQVPAVPSFGVALGVSS